MIPVESLAFSSWLGEDNNDRFGIVVANVGDIDGDGVADLAVGAPRNDVNRLSLVYVIPLGDELHPGLRDPGVDAYARFGLESGGPLDEGLLGHYVADLRDEGGALLGLLVGSPSVAPDAYESNIGAVYLIHAVGDRMPVDPDPEATGLFVESELLMSGLTLWNGEVKESYFGHGVSTARLKEADGPSPQIIITAPSSPKRIDARPGVVHLFDTPARPPVPGPADVRSADDAYATLETEIVSDAFGWRLATWDFTGEGRDDLAIGSRGLDTASVEGNVGAVYLVPGDLGEGRFSIPDSAVRTLVGSTGEFFGTGIRAGDLLGDGRATFVFSSLTHWYLWTAPEPLASVSTSYIADDPDLVATIGPRDPLSDVRCEDSEVADFDNDGAPDLVLGDCGSFADSQGRLYVFHSVDTLQGALSPESATLLIPSVGGKVGAELVCFDCEANARLAVGSWELDYGGSTDLGGVFLLPSSALIP